MIGIAGTGMLGKAVALRLIQTGHDVTVYNRTKSKTDSVQEAGGMVVDTPRELARTSSVVFTVVRDAAAVRSISFGDNGLVQGMHAGMIVADMSTILPAQSRKIHQQFFNHGIDWLDVPVMGGPDAVAEGRLVAMIGGKWETYQQINEILSSLTIKQHYLGHAGSAHSVKLAMNLQIAMLALSLSEGMCIVRGLGVEPETFLDVLNSTYFGTGMSKRKALKMAKGRYPATFMLENLTKDLETMQDAMLDAKIHLPMLSEALQTYQKATKEGYGHLDYTGIMEYIEKKSHSK